MNRFAAVTRVRGVLLVLGFAVGTYVLSYSVLSLCGYYGYTQSGELRDEGGLSVSDLEMFQPLLARWQPRFRTIDGSYISRGNALGRFYSPMIWLDRRLVHRTRLVPFLHESKLLESDGLAETYREVHGVALPDDAGEVTETK